MYCGWNEHLKVKKERKTDWLEGSLGLMSGYTPLSWSSKKLHLWPADYIQVRYTARKVQDDCEQSLCITPPFIWLYSIGQTAPRSVAEIHRQVRQLISYLCKWGLVSAKLTQLEPVPTSLDQIQPDRVTVLRALTDNYTYIGGSTAVACLKYRRLTVTNTTQKT